MRPGQKKAKKGDATYMDYARAARKITTVQLLAPRVSSVRPHLVNKDPNLVAGVLAGQDPILYFQIILKGG